MYVLEMRLLFIYLLVYRGLPLSKRPCRSRRLNSRDVHVLSVVECSLQRQIYLYVQMLIAMSNPLAKLFQTPKGRDCRLIHSSSHRLKLPATVRTTAARVAKATRRKWISKHVGRHLLIGAAHIAKYIPVNVGHVKQTAKERVHAASL